MSFLPPNADPEDQDTDGAPSQTSYDLLAETALNQLVPASLDARLRGPAPLIVLVEACSGAWVDALRRQLSRRFGHARVRAYKTGTKRTGATGAEEDHLVLSIQEGQTVIAVTTDIEGLVPQTLRLGVDETLRFDGLSPRTLRKAIRLVTGKPMRLIAPNAALQLDLPDLSAAIRVFSTPSQCLERLNLAVQRKVEAVTSGSKMVPVTQLPLTAPVRQWTDSMLLRMHQLERGDILMQQSPFTLLGGPPGTGKTMLAEALAQAAGWRFVATSAQEWFERSDGYLGGVTKAAAAFFQQLQEQPKTLGLIDELDAIPDRAALDPRQREWWTTLVTALLLNIDKLRRSAVPSVLLAASNFPERIDAALLRPQRISHTLRVEAPRSAEEIAAFFRYQLGNGLSEGELMQAVHLVISMGLPSPAAIADWVGNAKALALGAGRPLVFADLEHALVGVDARPFTERRRVAIHEAGHAVIAACLGVPFRSVSILASGDTGGRLLTELRTIDLDRRRVENLVTVALAGRATDDLLLGIVDAAASTDLTLATNLMIDAHFKWGLYDKISVLDLDGKTLHKVDRFTRAPLEAKLQELMLRAQALVKQHRATILAVAHELLSVRILSEGEVRKRVAATALPLRLPDRSAKP